MKTKNSIKGLALGVMFALTTSVSIFAGEGDSPSAKLSIVPYLSTDYSIVSYNNIGNNSATLTIKDELGNVVFSDKYYGPGFTQKVLDFSNIEDGTYNAELNIKGKSTLSKSFEIENHKLTSGMKNEASTYKPQSFANIVNNTLYVSHLSLGGNSFAVSISDKSGTTVYENEEIEKPIYSQKFDVTSLPKGEYTLSINSVNGDFSYDFQK